MQETHQRREQVSSTFLRGFCHDGKRIRRGFLHRTSVITEEVQVFDLFIIELSPLTQVN
jgi:hypothetical protein